MRVFVDSDVIISSLLSSTGAAYYLLYQSNIKPIISSSSLIELQTVVKRMNINLKELETLVKIRCDVMDIKKQIKTVKQKYGSYVNDEGDAHIVASAYMAKTEFLITYNLKHFKSDKIKDELQILVLTPAIFLQYLRSL